MIFKGKKGITLIALVITIIVLIILATVSINIVFGQNGIITMVKQASKAQAEAEVKEKVGMILAEYEIEKNINNKTLLAFLQDKKVNKEIDEITEDKEDEMSIEVDGYELVIEKSSLNIIQIGKAGLKPKVTNIKITTDGEMEVEDKSVAVGNPLQINFDHSINGGTTTVDKPLPYITNGIETEVTFIVTGTVNGKSFTNTVVVSLESKYREPAIAEVVEIGDFVNYSLGNWTEEDISKIGDLYSGTSAPSSEKFGGFGIENTKDGNVNTETKYSGWRVLSKNLDGTVNIIHAGAPESYYCGYAKALDCAKNLKYRDWSMYEDCSTNSVNTSYAVEGSAHCLTYQEAYDITKNENVTTNTLRAINTEYYIFKSLEGGEGAPYVTSTGKIGTHYGNKRVRPVVTLKAEVKATANNADTTHTTFETAWKISM